MNYWKWCRELKAAGSSHRLVLEMQCEWLSQRDRDQVARQLKVVDAVVAVSDHIARTFRSAFPDYPGVVATVGNGVDVSYFRPSEQRASASTRTRRVILFVGRVSPEKGLHTLIEAFSEVAARFADVELRIAGPHSPLPVDFVTSLSSDPRVTALSRFYDRWGNCKYREHLEELIERHGLRDRVQFVGNVPHKDLVATYHEADIVVNPSLSESFGISVVEGMACGIPVVGTRVGGMCESIVAGSTGMLVEVDAPGELRPGIDHDAGGYGPGKRNGKRRAQACRRAVFVGGARRTAQVRLSETAPRHAGPCSHKDREPLSLSGGRRSPSASQPVGRCDAHAATLSVALNPVSVSVYGQPMSDWNGPVRPAVLFPNGRQVHPAQKAE